MKKFKAMKAVYCYFFPEVEQLVRDVESSLLGNMNRVTTPAKEVCDKLDSVFSPHLEIPQTPEGYIDLDEIHVPIIERIVNAYSHIVPGLKDFGYRYPTSGSSEGIFKILAKLKVEGIDNIYVLNGEYEGYGEYAKELKMNVNIIDVGEDVCEIDIDGLKPGIWFVSNPSTCDGNIISNKFINDLCNNNHKVVLDLAYVGATRFYEFDVSHENIIAVLMSLSKPYGLFRYRIGFTFSRNEIRSLYGNKWFKDTGRLLQGLKVVEELGPDRDGYTMLYKKYWPVQMKIIKEINDEHGLSMKASDSLLLGYLYDVDKSRLNEDQLNMISDFKRGNGYRFCLTPYFEEIERNKEIE